MDIKIFIYALLSLFALVFSRNKLTICLLPDGNSVFIYSVLFLLLLCLFKVYYKKKKRKDISPLLTGSICVVFSLCTVGGKCYDKELTVSLRGIINKGFSNSLCLFLILFGAWILYYHIFQWIMMLLYETFPSMGYTGEKWLFRLNDSRLSRIMFGRLGTLFQASFLLLCWIPQVLIRYPGALSIDALNSLSQYYGMTAYYSKHPVIYARLFGFFIDLGRKFATPNDGLFLFMLFQVALSLAAVLYTIWVLRSIGVEKYICILVFILLLWMPTITAMATTAVKDTPFCIAFMFIIDSLILLLLKHNLSHKHGWICYIILFTALFGLRFRNNGIHIHVLSILLLLTGIVIFIFKHRVKPDRCLINALTVLILAFIASQALVTGLNARYNVARFSGRVMLSMPIQQIGRYMCFYPDDIQDEEMETLHRIIDIDKDQYPEVYTPDSFDGLKRYFSLHSSYSNLSDFFRLWFKLFLRHPDVYIDATIHQNYPLFSILINNNRYYNSLVKLTADNLEYQYDFSDYFFEKESLIPFQSILMEYYKSCAKMPFWGLILCAGFSTMLLLSMLIVALSNREWRVVFLLLLPSMILGFTFFGPEIMGSTRYVYPIIWTCPALVSVFLRKEKK